MSFPPAIPGAVWPMIAWERHRLADELDALSPSQWALPTRCGDWTVRQVVGHVSGLPSPWASITGLIAQRGNVDAFIDAVARERATAEPASLIEDLRAFATSRRVPPGVTPSGSLLEAIVHGDDIRRAVGASIEDRPDAHLVRALDFAVRSRGPFHGHRRAAGVALVADDIDWAHGSGARATGAALDLLGALLGRGDAAARLSGDGARLLNERAG